MDLPESLRGQSLTRRQILSAFGMLGATAVISQSAAAWAAGSSGAQLVKRAAATKAAGSDLGAIDHIVFLMMENRSYDHYSATTPVAVASTTTRPTRWGSSLRITPAPPDSSLRTRFCPSTWTAPPGWSAPMT